MSRSSRGKHQSYVNLHSNVAPHSSDASLTNEIETSTSKSIKSDLASVDTITKQLYNMPRKSASRGVENISPIVENCHLVQNVSDYTDNFPSLSTFSELNAKSIQSPGGGEENSSSSTYSYRSPADVTCRKEEPFPTTPSCIQNCKSSSEGSRGDEKSVSQQKGLPFDIFSKITAGCVKLKSPLHVRNKEKRKEMKRRTDGGGENIKILRPGMVLLKGYLPLMDQVKLISSCRDLGLGSGGFYQPGYSDGAKLQLKMMCLGKNWDPENSKYGDERPNDGAKPPPIPDEFRQMVKGAIQDCHDLLDSKSKMKIASTIVPTMTPNICIVNFYAKTGKLGLHQDKDESPESLSKGLPVVSFSIGDSAEFLYGDERDIDKAEKVLLESGDVLIFGGKSRHIFHGVSSIIPDTAPKVLKDEKNLKPGRLNLTFREY